MATRSEGTIALTQLGYGSQDFGKICGAIIGRGGSGIKQLTSKFPGLFIKVYDSRRGVGVRAPAKECDSIHISARESGDVVAVAKELAAIARAVMDGTLSRGPELSLACPPKTVGFVIGRGGSGLRRIGERAGDDCHIHYSRDSGRFHITATTTAACERARIYIIQTIKDAQKPRPVQVEQPDSRPASNGFTGLDVEDDDGDVPDEQLESAIAEHRELTVQATINAGQEALETASQASHDSIRSRRQRELSQAKRWEIREWLSKQTDPETGEPKFADFTRKDRQTGKFQRVTGVQAVPWSAVDDYIETKQKAAVANAELEKAKRRQEATEKRSYEELEAFVANRTNDDMFPTLGASTRPVANGWTNKPKSIQSADGVEDLNKNARKPRFVAARRPASKAVPVKMDITHLLPTAPKKKMVDLTAALLPTGPALSRMPVEPTLPEMDWRDQEYWDMVAYEEDIDHRAPYDDDMFDDDFYNGEDY